jgi:Tfp pilus assembly protein FimT
MSNIVDGIDFRRVGGDPRQLPVRPRSAGFSLIEVALAVFVGLMVTTFAIPNMLTVIATARLHGNMSSLSGVFQGCRMAAIKNNRTMTTRFAALTNGIVAYVKPASDSSSLATADLQVGLEAPITKLTSPSGPGAPSALSSGVLGFSPQTGNPSFNTRGLPCAYSGGSCTNQGFVYYFKDTRQGGSSGWAAVSISPAGRIKKWFWNGSAWGD